ncbi:MAG: alpha/beta fold hydrolase [Candidatus Acidiferrales bacterium]
MKIVKIAGIALALIVAVAGIFAFRAYRRCDQEKLALDDAARQSAEVRAYGGSYVRLPAGVTHYELAGPADAPTVVLIHGFSVPYYIWDPTFNALVAAGFRVLRYDLFGRGWSDRPDARYDADFFDEQLVQLLDALGIRGPIIVVGVSMGGPIAVNYAARHPERVRKLALFDPAYSTGRMTPWFMRMPVVSEYNMCTQIAPLLAASQREDFIHPERYPDYLANYLPQMRYRGFRHALLSSLRGFLSEDNSAAFAEVGRSGKPVLLVWGRADQDVPFAISDEVRKAIPQAEFLPVDDAAHVPFYEHPEIVNPVLIEFLRR